MRTTLDIDEEILRTVKDIAADRQESLGRVVSDLVKKGLEPKAPLGAAPNVSKFGIPVLPRLPGARTVTSQDVRDLMENED